MQDHPAPAEVDSQPSAPGHKWFHFRWRILLLVPVALLILLAVYGPRQRAQQRALVALRSHNAAIRTQPLAIPGVGYLFGEEYAQEIVEVYLRDAQLKDQELSVLTGLRTLQKLELAGSPVTSAGMVHLQGMPNLYILHLADTQVTDEGLLHLEGLDSLGVLSLNNTAITDDGLAHLTKLPKLERLFLDGAPVTDAGLAHLGKLTALKELSLVGTRITDAGLHHLHGLQKMEILKVYDTQVTPDALAELREALPNSTIWEPDPGQ